MDFAGRRFDLLLDFVKRERIIGPLVPIPLAVNGVKCEAGIFGGGLPVVSFGAGDALHRRNSRAAGVSAAGGVSRDRMAETAEPPRGSRNRAGFG